MEGVRVKQELWGLRTMSMVEHYINNMFGDIFIGKIHLLAEGWDYWSYLSESNYVIRVPKNPRAQTHLQFEMAKLPLLTLPLAVPRYIRTFGRVGIYPVIPGESADLGRIPGDDMVARLAQFLEALHRETHLSPQTRTIRGPKRWLKRFRRLHDEVADKVYPLLRVKEQRRCRQRFQDLFHALDSVPWSCTLIHGDLSLEHILIDQGEIAGVIDFGDMSAGDPAYDLSGISPRWEKGRLEDYATRLDPWGRRHLYRWAAPLHDILYGLDEGNVESVEQALEKFRKGS